MWKLRKSKPAVRPKKTLKEMCAAVLSAVLWTISFFLAFVISSKSPFIWVPDLLLLLGFVPLLWIWSPAWPWFVFGLLNMFIGFVLEVVKYIPPAQLPVDVHPVQQHLMQFHVPMVWILLGFTCILYGTFRLIKNAVRHVRSKSKQS